MAPLIVILALVVAWLYSRGKSQASQDNTANYQGSDYSPSDYPWDGTDVNQYTPPGFNASAYIPGIGNVTASGPLGISALSYLQNGIEPPLAGARPGESPWGY